MTTKEEAVKAPLDGVVDYVGDVRGLGPTVLLSCGKRSRVLATIAGVRMPPSVTKDL